MSKIEKQAKEAKKNVEKAKKELLKAKRIHKSSEIKANQQIYVAKLKLKKLQTKFASLKDFSLKKMTADMNKKSFSHSTPKKRNPFNENSIFPYDSYMYDLKKN